MSAGPELVTAELRTHAGRVRGVADQVSAAGQKGSSADLGLETYGIIGQFFSAQARVKIGQMGGAIEQVGSGLDGLATAVTFAADSFAETETSNTDGFSGGGR